MVGCTFAQRRKQMHRHRDLAKRAARTVQVLQYRTISASRKTYKNQLSERFNVTDGGTRPQRQYYGGEGALTNCVTTGVPEHTTHRVSSFVRILRSFLLRLRLAPSR